MLVKDNPINSTEYFSNLYNSKLVLCKICEDPDMSSMLISCIYDYLNSSRKSKVSYFHFNDTPNVYVDIKLTCRDYVQGNTEIINAVITGLKEIVNSGVYYRMSSFTEFADKFKFIVNKYNLKNPDLFDKEILPLSFITLLLQEIPETNERYFRIVLI